MAESDNYVISHRYIGSQIVIGTGSKQIKIPINADTKLYSHHINGDYDMDAFLSERQKDLSKFSQETGYKLMLLETVGKRLRKETKYEE